MLTRKQIRMLELLDEQLLDCKECGLWTGGASKPYWTVNSKYAAIGEAPGEEEVNTEPFIGKAGKHLWRIMKAHGFKKADFLIVNTVNCRPIDNQDRNTKPTKDQCEECFPFVRKYLKIVRPKKVILLGNFAVGTFTGEYTGILQKNGMKFYTDFGPFILSVHPSVCIYSGRKGEARLYESIKKFKEII